MAKGDIKEYRGRGGGYGGGYSEYNDEGRGDSKIMWERFEREFNSSNNPCEWLFTIPDMNIYSYIRGTTDRYGVSDGIRVWHRESYKDEVRGDKWVDDRMKEDDGRPARMIKKHCGEAVWFKFANHVSEVYFRLKAELEALRREKDIILNERWEQERQEREAERVRIEREEIEQLEQDVDLTLGVIHSDFQQALRWREVGGLEEGEWIDDPYMALHGNSGFGEEVRYHGGGVKIQITLSLDLSNSMYYNGVQTVSRQAFMVLGQTLKRLQEEYPGNVFVSFYTFSDGQEGRRTKKLSGVNWDGSLKDGFAEFENFRDSRFESKWEEQRLFSGEDSWMYPLFEKIEKWENTESDPGAMRLDLVITDAVLEHPKDIRDCDVIQTRRDGSLQTVLLNFMPEKDWLNSTLPLRCVQYAANADNIGALARNVISHFLSVYI